MNTTLKVIRIHAKQTLVNYRKPTSYLLKETFPLPPYSTVIGMIHKACDYKEYHPMQISVQGTCGPTISDLYTRYTFSGRKEYEEGRHNVAIINEEERYGMFRGVSHIELITDIDLVIHILPQPEDFEFVYQSLLHPKYYLALGRHEDLLDIIDVQVEECTWNDEPITKANIFIPYQGKRNEDGTIYKIMKEFYVDSKTNLRIFKEPIRVRCVKEGTSIEPCYVDSQDYPLQLV